MRFPLRHLAVLVALGLLLAGCSDEGTSSPPADTRAGGDQAGDGGRGLADDDRYCALSDQSAVLAAGFAPSTATPAETEAFYREQLVLIDGALGVVPEVLAEDLGVQRSVLVETIDVLVGVDWDLARAVDELTPLYVSPEYLAADGRLEAYDLEVCGFAPVDLVPAEPAEVPPEYAAYCDAAFAASNADELPFDAGPAEVQFYYEGLLASLEELAVLATPDLEADLRLIRDNFVEVVAILADVDWDLDIGFPIVEEWSADPAIADPMDAAIGRVERVDADVCGIVY